MLRLDVPDFYNIMKLKEGRPTDLFDIYVEGHPDQYISKDFNSGTERLRQRHLE